MRVNEIFTSIEGEGLRAGELVTFIRFTGCNLRCDWCDTVYSFNEGTDMTIEEIIEKIPTDIRNITLTGGEPMLQEDILELIDRLYDRGHDINVETNGAVDITQLTYRRIMITADYKLPSSKMESKMDMQSLKKLRTCDVLKFVIGSDEDLKRTGEIIRDLNPRCYIYLSSVFGRIEPSRIVEWMKKNTELLKKYNVRFQLQIHKFVWNPDTRGV